MEPTTVVAKAWEQIDRIARARARRPERVLVTGAGPIGLLAALLARQRGSRSTCSTASTDGPEAGARARPRRDLPHRRGADVEPAPDIIVEATGAARWCSTRSATPRANGIVCLTGISAGGARSSSTRARSTGSIVLENDVVFGSVNANLRHYEAAAAALAAPTAAGWSALITRRVPLDRWHDALAREPDDIKVVVELGAA